MCLVLLLVNFLLSQHLLCYVGVRDLCLSLVSTIAWLIETLVGSEVRDLGKNLLKVVDCRDQNSCCPSRPPKTLESYFDELREGDLIQPSTQPLETGPKDESRRQKQLTPLIKPPLEIARQEISLGRFEEDHSR